MQFSRGFKIAYWLGLIAVLTWFLLLRAEDAVAGRATGADALVFAVWIALLLAPLFAEVELLGIKLKQVVEEAKKEVKGEISHLRQDIVNAINIRANFTSHIHFPAQSHIDPAQAAPVVSRRPMEYQILNTLWTKQVNKWPDRSKLFAFRVDFPDPALNQQFREAASKLLGEGLIGETDERHVYLTDAGFAYARTHYHEFPPDQWWPEETIEPAKVKRVLEASEPIAQGHRILEDANDAIKKASRALEAAEPVEIPLRALEEVKTAAEHAERVLEQAIADMKKNS